MLKKRGTCRLCGKALTYGGRGRPKTSCGNHRRIVKREDTNARVRRFRARRQEERLLSARSV